MNCITNMRAHRKEGKNDEEYSTNIEWECDSSIGDKDGRVGAELAQGVEWREVLGEGNDREVGHHATGHSRAARRAGLS